MNGQDQITVIAAKMESVIEQRCRMLDADIEALRRFNEALLDNSGKDASERFAESLDSLRETMSE